MKENRSMFVVILLSLITFGIYGLYFTYSYARDMNIVCEGDGKKTGGLLAQIFLTLITFGIYYYVWTYKVGERIRDNCQKNGVESPCTGGSLLLWDILGAMIIIGPLVAYHKEIKGLNMLCTCFNSKKRSGSTY